MKGKPGRAYLLGTYLWEKNMFIDEKDHGIEETQDWLRENLHELFVLDGKTMASAWWKRVRRRKVTAFTHVMRHAYPQRQFGALRGIDVWRHVYIYIYVYVYVGISLVAKNIEDLVDFCPNCGIHDNAKAPQTESAEAACFPLTSQHSGAQTQWTCRWQLGTSAGSIHFTILQLWCDHSALDVSDLLLRTCPRFWAARAAGDCTTDQTKRWKVFFL